MPPIHSRCARGRESMRKSLFGVSVAALALSSSQPLVAQSDGDQQLGNVNFKTSCNEVAQRRFDRGMRYQHSYWYVNVKSAWIAKLGITTKSTKLGYQPFLGSASSYYWG